MELQNATSFNLLGKRWSALIVQDLDGGPRRFRELLAHVGPINDKVLSQRLKELEQAAIIHRQLFAEVPTRVEYTLTEKGKALLNIVREMERWDVTWANGLPRTHAAAASKPAVPVMAAAGGGVATEARASTPQPAPLASPASQPPPSQVAGGVRGFWKRLGL